MWMTKNPIIVFHFSFIRNKNYLFNGSFNLLIAELLAHYTHSQLFIFFIYLFSNTVNSL